MVCTGEVSKDGHGAGHLVEEPDTSMSQDGQILLSSQNLFLNKFLFYFVRMGVLPARTSTHHHVRNAKDGWKGLKSPEIGATDGCELP